MRLVARGGLLQLLVADDGGGCDPEVALRAGGSGLSGMRERLRLHGGHLDLRSAPGHGTRLRASVPLVDAAPPASAPPDGRPPLA
jgi:signal transduction histidine kinase